MHLAAVIDSHEHEVIGDAVALQIRAKETERATETAYLAQFATLRRTGAPILPCAITKRVELSGLPLSAILWGLPADAGIHHAVHSGAEWDHRTILRSRKEEYV